MSNWGFYVATNLHYFSIKSLLLRQPVRSKEIQKLSICIINNFSLHFKQVNTFKSSCRVKTIVQLRHFFVNLRSAVLKTQKSLGSSILSNKGLRTAWRFTYKKKYQNVCMRAYYSSFQTTTAAATTTKSKQLIKLQLTFSLWSVTGY